jgi:hypothetical protein
MRYFGCKEKQEVNTHIIIITNIILNNEAYQLMIQLVKGACKKTNQPHISYAIVRP